MDVIVLGGGLMGTASALFLARRGVRVTLIERRRIGAGATVASFGNIRRSGRHLSQLPLAARSLAIWNDAERLLERDVEFRATGHLRLIFDKDGHADMQAYAAAARPLGLTLEELTPGELRQRFAGLGPDAIAASFSPDDGSANPRLIAPAFADAAARAGARIVDECPVETIRHGAAGFTVETTNGVYEAEILAQLRGRLGRRDCGPVRRARAAGKLGAADGGDGTDRASHPAGGGRLGACAWRLSASGRARQRRLWRCG